MIELYECAKQEELIRNDGLKLYREISVVRIDED